MTHRHRNRTTRTPRRKPPKPITLQVILPAPITKPPVVTWQAKGRKVLIQIKDFFIG